MVRRIKSYRNKLITSKLRQIIVSRMNNNKKDDKNGTKCKQDDSENIAKYNNNRKETVSTNGEYIRSVVQENDSKKEV